MFCFLEHISTRKHPARICATLCSVVNCFLNMYVYMQTIRQFFILATEFFITRMIHARISRALQTARSRLIASVRAHARASGYRLDYEVFSVPLQSISAISADASASICVSPRTDSIVALTVASTLLRVAQR